MPPKSQRLTKQQFDTVFKIGKRYHTTALQLIHVPKTNFSGAVVVGKKVYKRAVDRNKMRRRLYGVLYREYKGRKQTGTFIVIAKPAAKTYSRQTLIDETKTLLDKVVVV